MSASRLVSSPLLRGAVAGSSRSTLRSMATVQSRIGDRQVEMSNLEKGKFINYQRIEDNLQVVRSR
jgi:aconitate hydratase